MAYPAAHDFESAGARVLELLRKRFGYDLWMITRREGNDLVTLQAAGGAAPVESGTVTQWSDSLCYRMAETKAPRIAPSDGDEPDLRETKLARDLDIKAYIGMPLTTENGDLFGSLCAFDGVQHPLLSRDDQDLIELFAGMLTSMLRCELRLTESQRQSERLAMEAQTDALTGLYNRQAWDDLIAKEEMRCRRYGHPAAVVVIDLDGLEQANDARGHAAGDDLIRRAASALQAAARTADVVARLGGDEFGILAVECDVAAAIALRRRIDDCLEAAGVSASCGLAVRRPSEGLLACCAAADELMYREKRGKRAATRS